MTANVSQSHNFPNGTNRIRIKLTTNSDLQLSLDNFATTFYTVDAGCEWSEDKIYFQTTTIYFRSLKNSTLQIMQWF
jgi:hypothetical protein